MGLDCKKPGGCKFPKEMCLASCSLTLQSQPLSYKPAPLPKPDCWAILTPNGPKLVSPDEAHGRKDAYPLYTATQMYAYRDGSAVPCGVPGGQAK